MTWLELFVENHQVLAYFAIFVGLFIEQDLTFLLASVFAEQGELRWGLLIFVAFVGVLIGDIALYWLGKGLKNTRVGEWIAGRFTGYHRWLDENFVARYQQIAVFSKYITYVNRLTPFLAGWHNINFKKFLRIHLWADLVWLAVLTFIGHSLGLVIAAVGPRKALRRIELIFIGIAVAVIGGQILLKRLFVKKIKRGTNTGR